MAPNLFPPAVRNLLLLVVTGLAVMAGPVDAWAKAKPSAPAGQGLVLRTATHSDFDRLVFEGPRRMAYKIYRDGGKISIQLAVKGSIDLKPAASLTRAKGFAAQGAGKDGKGNLTVSFTVDPKAIVKDFAKGSSVVVDIYGAAATLSAKAEPPNPEKTGVDKAASQPETGAKAAQ
ncbi:MAG: hypothetical protein PHY92_08850, partial [Alphaproteobacteria bacterium]|nr:hypothetical protein [Alphaproteobacteria bacterium]